MRLVEQLLATALHLADSVLEIVLDVEAQALVERTRGVVLVVEQHVAYRAQRVVVVADLVTQGDALLRRGVDAGVRELAQLVADIVQQDHNHIVHKGMSVHIEIGLLGYDILRITQVSAKFVYSLLHLRMITAECASGLNN